MSFKPCGHWKVGLFWKGWTSLGLRAIPEKIYRLRIGDYRVVFLTAEDAIYILRVVSRQELEKVLRQLRP
jgi:hypothetical protein